MSILAYSRRLCTFFIHILSITLALLYQRSPLLRCTRRYSSMQDIQDSREQTKLFGRLADNYLLLDIPFAGTPGMMNCCHGGCDNCDFSRVFDNLSSGRPKWIPTYFSLQLIDGRNHMSPWAKGLYTVDTNEYIDLKEFKDIGITEQEFIDRIKAMPYQASLGPPITVPATEMPTDDSVFGLWGLLVKHVSGLSEEGRLSPSQMSEALKKMTGEEHGITWSGFSKSIATFKSK